jgi:hypothetical protein
MAVVTLTLTMLVLKNWGVVLRVRQGQGTAVEHVRTPQRGQVLPTYRECVFAIPRLWLGARVTSGWG